MPQKKLHRYDIEYVCTYREEEEKHTLKLHHAKIFIVAYTATEAIKLLNDWLMLKRYPVEYFALDIEMITTRRTTKELKRVVNIEYYERQKELIYKND